MDTLAASHDAAVRMIYTSVVRVHQHGACIADNKEQHMGRPRRTYEQDSCCCGHRQSTRAPRRTAGEAHDNRLCLELLNELRPRSMLLADRGYDADWI
jgi:hypothetical protein